MPIRPLIYLRAKANISEFTVNATIKSGKTHHGDHNSVKACLCQKCVREEAHTLRPRPDNVTQKET